MQASRFVRELFKNPRTISAIVPPAPAEGPGGRLPHGGVCCMVQHWNVCMIVFWRAVWYRAGTFLCMRSWPRRARRARPSCPSVVPVRRAWSCMAAAAMAAWFLCRSRVVATRRQMLAFAMVLMASHYPDLHNKSVVCIVKPCQPVERSAQQGAAAITEPPLATGLIPVR